MCDEYDPEGNIARGRAYFDSPGIDGSVTFPGPCMPGDIVQLRVLSAEGRRAQQRTHLTQAGGRKENELTTASKITIVRMILIPVVLVLMYLDFEGHMYWALAAFVVASLSTSRTATSPATTTR